MKALILTLLLLLSAQPWAGSVDSIRATNADSDSDNWLLHGRTYSEQRHSPLKQISVETVSQLGLTWFFDSNSKRALEGDPHRC